MNWKIQIHLPSRENWGSLFIFQHFCFLNLGSWQIQLDINFVFRLYKGQSLEICQQPNLKKKCKKSIHCPSSSKTIKVSIGHRYSHLFHLCHNIKNNPTDRRTVGRTGKSKFTLLERVSLTLFYKGLQAQST